MHTTIVSVLLTAALSAATGTAQPKTAPTPRTDPEVLGDPDFPSMFELPNTRILEADGAPGNIVPRLAWLRADYLFWWGKQQIVSPLIQTMPDSLASATTLPAGAASTLFPDDGKHIRYPVFSGARLNAGFWFSREQRLGLDGTFFQLEQNSNGASFRSAGSPILARPYVNANSGTQTSLHFSNPDSTTGYSGSLYAVASLTSLWGADASLRWNGFRMFSDNTDWLFGGRYFEMRERLQISGQAVLKSGTQLNVNDYFTVSNQFYGGQLGVHARWGNYFGFSVDGIVKLAVGGVSQRVAISGDNTLTVSTGSSTPEQAMNPRIADLPKNLVAAGFSTTEEGGLYAQPSNIGVHRRTRIAYMPEVTLNLNYNLTERAAIYAGYNFLYISSVMRVANAIDENINDSSVRYIANPTQGGAAGPVFRYNAESFWLHGINLGLRLEY